MVEARAVEDARGLAMTEAVAVAAKATEEAAAVRAPGEPCAPLEFGDFDSILWEKISAFHSSSLTYVPIAPIALYGIMRTHQRRGAAVVSKPRMRTPRLQAGAQRLCELQASLAALWASVSEELQPHVQQLQGEFAAIKVAVLMMKADGQAGSSPGRRCHSDKEWYNGSKITV